MARARLLNNTLTITGYGGAAVGPEFTMPSKFSDNVLYGGQAVTTALRGTRIGLSYMKRKKSGILLDAPGAGYLLQPYAVVHRAFGGCRRTCERRCAL